MILQKFTNIWQDESGATVVDYGIVFLLLAIASAAAFDTVGDSFSSLLSLVFAD